MRERKKPTQSFIERSIEEIEKEAFKEGYEVGFSKACEWLKEQDMTKHISVLSFGSCSVSFDTNSLMEAFRKALED